MLQYLIDNLLRKQEIAAHRARLERLREQQDSDAAMIKRFQVRERGKWRKTGVKYLVLKNKTCPIFWGKGAKRIRKLVHVETFYVSI